MISMVQLSIGWLLIVPVFSLSGTVDGGYNNTGDQNCFLKVFTILCVPMQVPITLSLVIYSTQRFSMTRNYKLVPSKCGRNGEYCIFK